MAESKEIEVVIRDSAAVFNSAFIPLVLRKPETKKPLLILEGGRGSGKSRAVAQRLVLTALKKKVVIALVRKVARSIRDSQYREIKNVVDRWGLSSKFTFLSSRLAIEVTNGSEFICVGLDDPEKAKSLADVDAVWIEEATEITKNDWDTFRFSIRGESVLGVKQKILTFNRTAGSWTEEMFFNSDESFRVDPNIYHHHSTYRDNRWIGEDSRREIEETKITDPELYRKVAEGRPIRLRGLIITNWRLIDEFPEICDEVLYGLDFGVSDPTVLVKVGISGRNLYVDELFYERGKTNQDLLEVLPELIRDRTTEIYADSEDPNRILEIYRAGWNIKPANKEQNSVKEGLDFLRGYAIHLTARSTNVRKDVENYSWKKDKNGIEVTPETPMHAFSHGVDPVRYVAYTHVCKGTPTGLSEMKEVRQSWGVLESDQVRGY